MKKKAGYIQVLTATGRKEDAEKIADMLLENKLAACVQITEVESRYRWKGRIQSDREYLCIIKSRRALYGEIEKAIKALHPYEVPEIIAAEISAGSEGYLRWIEEETGHR